MPNTLAYVVLFSWPLVMVILFRRLPLPAALVWSILGGYLFLPPKTGIDLPVLPPLDKTTIPSFAAAIMCLADTDRKRRKGRDTTRAPALRGPVAACLALLFGAVVLTGVTNSGALFIGRHLPGLRPYDIGSLVMDAGLTLIPFLLARRYLATPEAQVIVLRALVLAGLTYSLLILVEVRLSPQLNRWLYGFHAHSFAQQIRFGGFRPTVFIEHGLRVGIFIAMSVLAAGTLWRLGRSPAENEHAARPREQQRPGRSYRGLALLWLVVILFLTKAVGAIIITFLLLLALLFLSARIQVLVAAGLAAVVLLFPMLRGADLVPTDTITGWASMIDDERAQSIQFRFDNEDILLDRANLKPLAGWGSFGRNRIYDPDTGRDISVTDGTWVIFMGIYGWLGYLGRFGLLTLPLIAVARSKSPDPATAGLALVLAANLMDLIPNSGLTPVTWMIAGALSAQHMHRMAAAVSRRRQTSPATARAQPSVARSTAQPAMRAR